MVVLTRWMAQLAESLGFKDAAARSTPDVERVYVIDDVARTRAARCVGRGAGIGLDERGAGCGAAWCNVGGDCGGGEREQ
jgi:hypothetical protein